jgi:AraC-like DNA-binding protein
MADLKIDLSAEGMEKHTSWPGPYDVMNIGMKYGGPDRFVWPPHYHEALELVSIPDTVGGCVKVSGRSFPLHQAACICFPPGHIHAYDLRFTGTPPFVIILINPAFFPGMFSMFTNCTFEQIKQKVGRLAYDFSDQALELNKLLFKLSRVQRWPNQKPADDNPVPAAMHDTGILFAILEKLFSTEPVSDIEIPDDTPVKRAIAIVRKNFQKPLTLDRLARESSISKYYLCKLFKTQTGISLWTYINSVRVHHATSLLSTGAANVTEACYASGFSDPSYFAKVFKHHTGIAPKKWGKAAG